jgi:hypothetical protein
MTMADVSVQELHMFFAGIDDPGHPNKLDKLDRLKLLMDDVESASQLFPKAGIVTKLSTLWGCAVTVHHDIKLVSFAHRVYLPAARNYLLRKKGARDVTEAKARLGRASRSLYSYQKKTFVDAINLLSPIPVPERQTDAWWTTIQRIEASAAKKARLATPAA